MGQFRKSCFQTTIFVLLIFCIEIIVVQCIPLDNNIKRQDKITENLDGAGKYILSWTINEDTKEISFEIEAETLGYVGLGISPTGSMANADIFIAGVRQDGPVPSIYYGDYHGGLTNGPPTLDEKQDWKLSEVRENATHTFIRVSRLLDTCDDQDYPITEESTSRIIWALGTTDDISYHGATNRGVKSINLIEIPEPEVDIEMLEKWSILVNTTMPSADTTYWCTIHKGPPLTQKHHVVGFEAYLESEVAIRHTHHFIVTKCYPPPGVNATELFGPYVNHPGEFCFKPNQELPSDYCSQYLFVWAVGGKRTLFPLIAGYPIDGSEENAYYMLEVHYDNPTMLEGVQFTTGLHIYHTDELRPRDAVMFAIGHDTAPSLLIPPQQDNFVIAGHCAPGCSKNLPSSGLNVFNALLHSHLSGRKLKLRHFRGDEEIKWLAFDDTYDFNFQQNKPLRNEVVILPGDQLTFECTYSSVWANGEVVIGGLSSRREMCLAFLWAYADSNETVKIGGCHSMYSIDATMLDFGITNWTRINTEEGRQVLIYEPVEMFNMTFPEALNKVFNWTPEFIVEQQIKHRYGEQDWVCCDRSAGSCADRGVIKYPEVEPYLPQPICE